MNIFGIPWDHHCCHCCEIKWERDVVAGECFVGGKCDEFWFGDFCGGSTFQSQLKNITHDRSLTKSWIPIGL